MTSRYSRNLNENFAILVLSCDKYSDMWHPFFTQFRKFWANCPFKVYLGSNTKKYTDDTVSTILSVIKTDWSSDLLKILSAMKEEYIFLWMEDLFLIAQVDTDLFLRGFKFMQRAHANHIHMSPYIRPDGVASDKLFGFYDKGVPYRVNAPGYWNKQHLQKLLISGENPWKFEILGSYRSGYYDGYYCINKDLFQFIRIIEKGTIRREAYDYCKKNGISLDNRRRVNTLPEEIKSRVQKYIFDGMLRIPWSARVGTMDALRRLIVSY